MHLDRPRPGFCWAQNERIMSRKGENLWLILYSRASQSWIQMSEQQKHVIFYFSRSSDLAGLWQKWILSLCTIHLIQWETAFKIEKNLVTFSNRNTPTKCFLLKYWWRRTSGLNSSIHGTHSSATTTRKHWSPFCKVRARQLTLIRYGLSTFSTHFPQNSTFLLIYE